MYPLGCKRTKLLRCFPSFRSSKTKGWLVYPFRETFFVPWPENELCERRKLSKNGLFKTKKWCKKVVKRGGGLGGQGQGKQGGQGQGGQ